MTIFGRSSSKPNLLSRRRRFWTEPCGCHWRWLDHVSSLRIHYGHVHDLVVGGRGQSITADQSWSAARVMTSPLAGMRGGPYGRV
jgi:hypothetical protein